MSKARLIFCSYAEESIAEIQIGELCCGFMGLAASFLRNGQSGRLGILLGRLFAQVWLLHCLSTGLSSYLEDNLWGIIVSDYLSIAEAQPHCGLMRHLLVHKPRSLFFAFELLYIIN